MDKSCEVDVALMGSTTSIGDELMRPLPISIISDTRSEMSAEPGLLLIVVSICELNVSDMGEIEVISGGVYCMGWTILPSVLLAVGSLSDDRVTP